MQRAARRLVLIGAAAVAALPVFAQPAFATAPGKDGLIAFERFFGGGFTSNILVTVDPADTSGAGGGAATSLAQIPSGVGQNHIQPVISPDGTRVAFSAADPDASGALRIWTQNIDGTNAHALPGDGNDTHPAWSSDGKQILFSSTRGGDGVATNLWLMSDTGASPIPITSGTGKNVDAVFSPDNTRIAWAASPVENAAATDIYVAALLDASHAIRVTNNDCLNDFPSWSPDGNKLAFHSQDNELAGGCANNNIDVVDVNGTMPVSLAGGTHDITKGDGVTHAEDNDHPAWSPDGTQIAFTSQRTDPSIPTTSFQYGVWLMNADGTSPRLLSKSGGVQGDEYPSWVTIPKPTEVAVPVDTGGGTGHTPIGTTDPAAGSGAAGITPPLTSGGAAPTPVPTPTPVVGGATTKLAPALAVAVQKVKAKGGAATVPVTIPGSGSVSITGAGVTPTKLKTSAAGALPIKLHLTAAEAKKLKRSHKVKVAVTITFTPAGGKPTTLKTTITVTS